MELALIRLAGIFAAVGLNWAQPGGVPIPKYNTCMSVGSSNSPNAFQKSMHQDVGCFNLFVGLGILQEIIPVPPPPPMPQNGMNGLPPSPSGGTGAIPSFGSVPGGTHGFMPAPMPRTIGQTRAREEPKLTRESRGGTIPFGLPGSPSNFFMAKRVGDAMSRAFSFEGRRVKRSPESWLKKGMLQDRNGWFQAGKRKTTRLDRNSEGMLERANRQSDPVSYNNLPSSAFNGAPGFTNPGFSGVPNPNSNSNGIETGHGMRLDGNGFPLNRKEIDKQICMKFRRFAKQAILNGLVQTTCCNLECYCQELERNSTSVCGGHANYVPPPGFPMQPSGNFGPLSPMNPAGSQRGIGLYPGGGLPPPVGPVSFTIPGEFREESGNHLNIPQPPPFPFFGGLNEKKPETNPFDAPQMLDP